MRRGRAADGTLQHCIYSGTALRCISPSPHYPRTRCPGLTENGSALRTLLRHSPPPRSRCSASPPTSALIVAERRHSAITRYAERSAACRDSTRPCCRRAGGTPLLQSRSPTARAVTPSVNPRQRRGHTHRRRCAAERRRGRAKGSRAYQKKSSSRGWRIQKYKCGLDYLTITLVAVPLTRTT